MTLTNRSGAKSLAQLIEDMKGAIGLVVLYVVLGFTTGPAPVNSWLSAGFSISPSRPWGIVTSIVVFDGWVNIELLAIACLSVVISAAVLTRIQRRVVSRIFWVGSVGGAIAGNAVWCIRFNYAGPVWGTSGVTLASMGAGFMASVLVMTMMLYQVFANAPSRRRPQRGLVRAYWMASLGFLGSLGSFSLGVEVIQSLTANFFIHGVSLMAGVIIAGIWLRFHVVGSISVIEPQTAPGSPIGPFLQVGS